MNHEDLLSIIRSRRSIRKYKSQEVPDEVLTKILEAGRWAPSAVNLQPWRFIVIKNLELINKIGEASRFYFVLNHHVSQAPVIIVVCSEDKDNKWAPIDCALASQNMMLEAHSLGLGTCFIGAFQDKTIRSLLGIPDKMEIIGLITLGYPEGEIEESSRLDLKDLVFLDYYDHQKALNIKKKLSTKKGILSFIIKYYSKFYKLFQRKNQSSLKEKSK